MQQRHAIKTLVKTFKLLIYADDIVLLTPTIQSLNKALKFFWRYLHRNKLELNPDKTKVVIFRKKKTNIPPLFLNNNIIIYIIEVVNGWKYLCITFSRQAASLPQLKSQIANKQAALHNFFGRNHFNSVSLHIKLFPQLTFLRHHVCCPNVGMVQVEQAWSNPK